MAGLEEVTNIDEVIGAAVRRSAVTSKGMNAMAVRALVNAAEWELLTHQGLMEEINAQLDEDQPILEHLTLVDRSEMRGLLEALREVVNGHHGGEP